MTYFLKLNYEIYYFAFLASLRDFAINLKPKRIAKKELLFLFRLQNTTSIHSQYLIITKKFNYGQFNFLTDACWYHLLNGNTWHSLFDLHLGS